MTLTAFLLFLPSAVEHSALYAPSSHDVHGWAIRVRAKRLGGPYFCGESPTHPMLEIILINKSPQTREYQSFEHALKTGDLGVNLKRVNGEYVRCYHEPSSPRPDPVRPQLLSGGRASRFLTLADFAYRRFWKPGEYDGQVEFLTSQGKVLSPPWRFTVVDVPADAVLDSHRVIGYDTERQEPDRARLFIQQVMVRGRVYLLHREFTSPKSGSRSSSIHRLAELTGKVEMTVDGVYGPEKPLIIRYRTSPSMTTTLTVHSVDGTVWDRSDRPARDGDLRTDNLDRQPGKKAPPGKQSPPIAPKPKPIKP